MFKLNPETVFRKEFDGTGILFNPDTGKTFFLNPTGRILYATLESCDSECEILNRLSPQTSLPEDAAAKVSHFIAELRQYGFLLE